MRVLLFLIFLCLAACRPKTGSNEQKNAEAPSPNITVAAHECYRYVKGRDTVTLMLLTSGTTVSGQLHYAWFEKDRSTGSLEGKMYGDTLLATYTFNAEGLRSVREVAFLKQTQQVIEGFGPVEENNGQVRFKDFRKLDFNGALVLDKVPCR